MAINIDADLENADWTKSTWDLPTEEVEFRAWLAQSGMTVAQFKSLPVYKSNRGKFPWLDNLGFDSIPDFKPGVLADLMSQQSMKPKK